MLRAWLSQLKQLGIGGRVRKGGLLVKTLVHFGARVICRKPVLFFR